MSPSLRSDVSFLGCVIGSAGPVRGKSFHSPCSDCHRVKMRTVRVSEDEDDGNE